MPPPHRRRSFWVILLAVSLVGYWFNNRYIAPSKTRIFDEWTMVTRDGVRALDGGRFAEAAQHFERARILADEMKPSDLRRGTTLHNLGELRAAQNRWPEAADLFAAATQALDVPTSAPQPELGIVLRRHAESLARSGRYADAVAPLERAIPVIERTHGRGPRLATALDELVVVLIASGRGSEATAHAKRARAIRDAVSATTAPAGVPANQATADGP